jgi:hypothetical protein
MLFPSGYATFFPPTGELLYCFGGRGMRAVHPTTGKQRLLALHEELGLPEHVGGVRLYADVDPARDRVFFHSFESGRIVVALSGLTP